MELGAASFPEELLDEVGQLTVEGIRQSRPRHAATHEGLQTQLTELASASCGLFIESADAVKGVHLELARVARHLQWLEEHIPLTANHADANSTIEVRRRNVALLSKHAEVLEMLEQPQLMDTCVRNGFIDEALELEAVARSRAIAHAGVCAHARQQVLPSPGGTAPSAKRPTWASCRRSKHASRIFAAKSTGPRRWKWQRPTPGRSRQRRWRLLGPHLMRRRR